ncbi:DUF7507 domain-containing protein [Arthrobacter alpinus]|nr:DUF11 domain-containing protein [Arthrobacter alpinus]
MLTAIGVPGFGEEMAHAAPAPAPVSANFPCLTPMIFVAQGNNPDGSGPTQLQSESYSLGQAQFTPIGTPWGGIGGFNKYNAIGFNTADNFLYGIANSSDGVNPNYHLLRIGEDGAPQDLGVIADMPTDSRFINAGAFHNGTYYVMSGESSAPEIFSIDLNTVTATTTTLSTAWTPADFTQVGNYLWGVEKYSGTFYRLDPTTGAVTTFPATSTFWNGNTNASAGAAFTFGNGNLGISSSDTGVVSQVKITDPGSAAPTFTLVSQSAGPQSNRNDGANCVPNPSNTDLEITKTGPPQVQTNGTINWTLAVKNNGPAISSGYTVSDTVPAGVTGVASTTPGCTVNANTVTCIGGTLLVGDSSTITLTGTAPPTDGTCVENQATVMANESDIVPANDTSALVRTCASTVVVPPAVPALSLVKTADATALTTPSKVGDTITYHFTATNTGNTPLTDVTITDPLTGLSALAYTWPGTAGTLAPGEKVDATATYQITQADINIGKVDNTAMASGNPPTGPPAPSKPASTSTPLTAAAALSLVKTADATALTTPSKVGDTITYHFTATNTGNTPLTDVTITDPLTGLSALAYTWPGTAGTLAPGEKVDATATYQITQADINTGKIDNTATATGKNPAGEAVPSGPSSTSTPLTAAAALSLVKTADATALTTPSKVGDTITYHFTATNTGNTPLTDVTITDPLTGLSALAYTWPGTAGTLAPGEKVDATATYQITQADINTGKIDNTATATGKNPAGEAVPSGPSSTSTPLTATPPVLVVPVVDPPVMTPPVAAAPVNPDLAYTGVAGLVIIPIALLLLLGGIFAFVTSKRRKSES